MSSSELPSNPSNSPSAAPRKPSNKSLAILAALMAGAGLAVLVIPMLLTQFFLAEEEAKRKQGPIVGTRTDVKPPPGVSTDPYAGMPSRQAGNGGNNAGGGEAAKTEAGDK